MFTGHAYHVLTDVPRITTAAIHTGWEALQHPSVASLFPKLGSNVWAGFKYTTTVGNLFIKRPVLNITVSQLFSKQVFSHSYSNISAFSSQRLLSADSLITTQVETGFSSIDNYHKLPTVIAYRLNSIIYGVKQYCIDTNFYSILPLLTPYSSRNLNADL